MLREFKQRVATSKLACYGSYIFKQRVAMSELPCYGSWVFKQRVPMSELTSLRELCL